MKYCIKTYFPLILTMTAIVVSSCSDWTNTEGVDIHQPSFEEQNPTLYAQYLNALCEYKMSDHKVTFVMMENREGLAPIAQNQRLTSYPDSVDIICMTHTINLASEYKKEIAEVRKKGTRVLYDIDYQQIENIWNAQQTSQQTLAGSSTSRNITKADEENIPEVTNNSDDSAFRTFCQERTEALLSCCDQYGFDGIVFSYDGPVLSSLSEEETIQLTGRLNTFFSSLKKWHESHPDKLFIFRGAPHKLTDCTLLADCSYIIVSASKAQSAEELSIEILRATVDGVPTDRFLIGVTTPTVEGNDNNGYFSETDAEGKSLYAMIGAARWTMVPAEYVKAGVAIDQAWNDYYDLNIIFPHIREVIYTMNPIPENQ